MHVSYVTLTARVLVAGVFLLAVVTKMRGRAAFEDFAESLTAARLVRYRLRHAVAAATVLAEVAVVVLLTVPRTVTAGLALAALVSTVFALGIGLVLRRGTPAACRCFGRSRTVLGAVHVARNAVLVAVALVGIAAAGTSGPLEPGGVAVALAAAAVLVVVVRFLDDIVPAFTVTAPAAR